MGSFQSRLEAARFRTCREALENLGDVYDFMLYNNNMPGKATIVAINSILPITIPAESAKYWMVKNEIQKS